jgi:hypothetical protein
MSEKEDNLTQDTSLSADQSESRSCDNTVISNVNIEQGAIPKKGTREIKLTEKGLEWRIDQEKGRLRTAISSWRTHFNELSVLVSDSDNVKALRQFRDKLQDSFNDIDTCRTALDSLTDLANCEARLLLKLESIESDHTQMLQAVSGKIYRNIG